MTKNPLTQIVVPLVLVGVIIAVAVLFFKVISPSGSPGPQVRQFNLLLKNDQYNPSKIQVGLNDNVTLNIENKDNVNHGLHLPDFAVTQAIPPMSRKTVEFVASKKGLATGGCVNDQHNEKLDVEVFL